MLRSVSAVVAAYLIFAVSAALLFGVSGRDPHVRPDAAFAVLGVLYGMLFALIAGYVAGVIAKRSEIRHGLVVALIIVVLAALSLVLQLGEGSLWSELATIIFMAPAAVLGGYLRHRQRGEQ
jgi:hypothetical protein